MTGRHLVRTLAIALACAAERARVGGRPDQRDRHVSRAHRAADGCRVRRDARGGIASRRAGHRARQGPRPAPAHVADPVRDSLRRGPHRARTSLCGTRAHRRRRKAVALHRPELPRAHPGKWPPGRAPAPPVGRVRPGGEQQRLTRRLARRRPGRRWIARRRRVGEGSVGSGSLGDGSLGGSLATGSAIFTGELPCTDCAAVRHQLELFGDESFFLRRTYVGKGRNAVVDEIGTWTLSRDRSTLTLSGGGEAPLRIAIGRPNTLHVLPGRGESTGSSRTNTLRLSTPRAATRASAAHARHVPLHGGCGPLHGVRDAPELAGRAGA